VTLPNVERPHPQAGAQQMRQAAEVLNAAKKPVILVGVGALHARDEVIAAAEKLGAPVVKTLPGKAVVPDDHPVTTGGLGLLGTKPSEEAMEECDTLLMVGTSFPYGKYLPQPGEVRVVQIDTDPTLLGLRLPVEAPVAADAKDALRNLLPLLHGGDGAFLTKYRTAINAWRADMKALQDPDRDPIAPQYLMGTIDELAAENAILTCDSGTIATWSARHWTIRGGREYYLSGNPRHDGAPDCRTRSLCSMRFRAARSSRTSATGASRCSWQSSSPPSATSCPSRCS
jgi:thiamine pyrophosphate-dependent acetolactate synthase large subunit-like protein